MKTTIMTTTLLLGIFFASGAQAHQIFRCSDKGQGVKVKLTLANETESLNQISINSEILGLFVAKSGLGSGKPWQISNLEQTYWNQVEGKPSLIVFMRDVRDGSINYQFSFSKDLLGQQFSDRKVVGWIDHDTPHFGAHSLNLLCSSTGST